MFRNILFAMSLSGSVVVLLYLFFYPLAKRYFPLVWRYRVLKIAVFFYLVPVSRWKYQVLDIGRTLFPKLWEEIYAEPDFHGRYSIIIENGLVRWSAGVYGIMFFLVICVIVSVLLFSESVFQDQKIKIIYRNSFEEPVNQTLHQIFLQVKKELHIKRQVKLKCSGYCQSPVTCGVLFPVIYFPDYRERKQDDSSLRYMVKHELLHIKRNDILMRYLGLLVVAVHWFNPLSYFLAYELSGIGEMYCDSGVLEGEGEEGRKKYGELLLQTAMRKEPDKRCSFFVGMAGTRQKKIMKRRIIEMKAKRTNQIVLSILAMVFVGMAGGITAFAYEPPQTVQDAGDDRLESNWMMNDSVVSDGWYLDENEKPPVISWDSYFIDSTGTATEATELVLPERILCNHDYSIPGTYYKHVKNSRGGCTVTEYDALKCSLCGSLLKGDETNVVTYQKCPH